MRPLPTLVILGNESTPRWSGEKRGKEMRLTSEWVKVALAALTLVLLAVHAFTG